MSEKRYAALHRLRLQAVFSETQDRTTGKVLQQLSSCFFCPSMRAEEIIDLRERYPDLFRRALALEDNARANLKTVRGLGRNYSWKERFGKEQCNHGND